MVEESRQQVQEKIFELTVSRISDDGHCMLEARSPPGGDIIQQTIKAPVPAEWKNRLEQLQKALLFSPISPTKLVGRLRDTNPDSKIINQVGSDLFYPRIVKEIGKDLFDILFTRRIFSAYDASWTEANKNSTPLKVRLSFQDHGLSSLPWETLCDGEDYLALSTRTPVVRSTDLQDDDKLPPEVPPLGVLGMVPRVRNFDGFDLARLNVEAEQANIKLALKDLEDRGLAVLQWASGSTSDLTERLTHPPEKCGSWHVFHFSGHGGFDDEEKQGFIVVDPDPEPIGLEGDNNSARALYADDLKDVLQVSKKLRLVILNSCRGAMGNLRATSAAEHLVSKGFSAVIAMQFEISDLAAILFSAVLYKHLLDGDPVEVAVTLARQRLKQERSPEWITPVLYTRSRDGRLFRQ
jgi:CHAT domain